MKVWRKEIKAIEVCINKYEFTYLMGPNLTIYLAEDQKNYLTNVFRMSRIS